MALRKKAIVVILSAAIEGFTNISFANESALAYLMVYCRVFLSTLAWAFWCGVARAFGSPIKEGWPGSWKFSPKSNITL
jgi:hypothetical protein